MKKEITKNENELIEALRKKSVQIEYGQINLEIKIKKKRMSFMRIIREEETVTFGND